MSDNFEKQGQKKCLWLCGLTDGVKLIILLDCIVTISVIIMFSDAYRDASGEVVREIIAEKPNTKFREPGSYEINLFTMSTDGVTIVLYIAKLLCGMAFFKASSCPPGKEFEYKYDDYVGEIRWQIRLAK